MSRLDNPSYMGVENEVHYHMLDWWEKHPAPYFEEAKREQRRFRAQVEEEIRREASSRQFKGWGSHPEGVPF